MIIFKKGLLLVCFLALLAPGSHGHAEEPALPEGLAPASSSPEPPLPSGLEDTPEPTLPEGLEPALPPGLDASSPEVLVEETPPPSPPFLLHGFWDLRAGSRIQADPAQAKDATLGEMRLQLKTDKSWNKVFFEFTSDGVFDAINERAKLDLRQLRLTWTPVDALE